MSLVVVDAAAVVDLICDLPPAAGVAVALAGASQVAAPAHLDAEVLSALGRQSRAGALAKAGERVAALADFPAHRWPLRPLLGAAWGLTDQIAVRDALYVALARSLDARLVTTDARLARAAASLVTVAAIAQDGG